MEIIMNTLHRILLILALTMLPALSHAMQVIDATGHHVSLNETQMDALKKCALVKQTLELNKMEMESLDFSHCIDESVSAKNIGLLIQLLENPASFNLQNSDIIEVFKVADYLQAPQYILGKLALKCHEIVTKAIQQEEKNKEKSAFLNMLADSDQLKELKRLEFLSSQCLPYYMNFTTFLNDCRTHDFTQLLQINSPQAGMITLNLSHENIEKEFKREKKIASLEGIEKLAECPWASRVTHFVCSGHLIKNYSLAQLKKTFPNLIEIDLGGNSIAHADLKQLNQASSLLKKLDLSYNEIKDLDDEHIGNPLQFANTLIDMKHNGLISVNNHRFIKLSIMQKIFTWMKAFGAQSKVFSQTHYLDLLIVGVPVALIRLTLLLDTLVDNDENKIRERSWQQALLEGRIDPELFNRVICLFPQKKLFYGIPKEVLIPLCVSFGLLKLLEFALGANQLRFAPLVAANPYSVRIETDNQAEQYPSTYTYRLLR